MSPPPFATRQVDLPFNTLHLYPLNDVHREAPGHASETFQATLKRLRDSDDSHRAIVMGDYLDINVKTSKHFEHGRLTPNDALELAVKDLEPIAHKIDLIIPGNHEHRLERAVGLDLMAQLSSILRIPKAYQKHATVLKYRFSQRENEDRTRYDGQAQIYCFHGRGGGRRTGQKINMVEDLALVKPDCDVYMAGHVHGSAYSRDQVFTGFPVTSKMRHFLVTGHYQGPERYAIDAAHRPNVCESPVIKLSYNKTAQKLMVEPSWP